MFTGIIRTLGTVASASTIVGGNRRLVINPDAPWSSPAPRAGDSIAVDGCCLTLVPAPAESFVFEAIPETLAKTTLGMLAPGDRVHLEQAATASTLLDGHLVQGHIDGVAVVDRVDTAEGWRLRLRPPPDLMPYVVPKGSVCLAGVSLTVAAVSPAEGWFEVALIPTTLDLTLLGRLVRGSRVNLECDATAKTIVHYLRHYADQRRDLQGA
jgi:riboflavin synthase